MECHSKKHSFEEGKMSSTRWEGVRQNFAICSKIQHLFRTHISKEETQIRRRQNRTPYEQMAYCRSHPYLCIHYLQAFEESRAKTIGFHFLLRLIRKRLMITTGQYFYSTIYETVNSLLVPNEEKGPNRTLLQV